MWMFDPFSALIGALGMAVLAALNTTVRAWLTKQGEDAKSHLPKDE